MPGLFTRNRAVAKLMQLNESFDALMTEGRYDEARTVASSAAEVALDNFGPDRPEYAAALARVAIAAQGAGDLQAAEGAYSAAVDAAIKALGPTHPDVANAIFNLADLQAAAGRTGAAAELYERALSIMRGDVHSDPDTIAVRAVTLNELYGALGEPLKARNAVMDAAAAVAAADGKQTLAYATLLNSLALCESHMGKPEIAEQLFSEAAAIGEGVPDGVVLYAGILENLGALQARTGRDRDAEETYLRAIAVLRDAGHEAEAASTIRHLGMLRFRQGDYREAEALLRTALRLRQDQGAGPLEQAEGMLDLSELYRATGVYATARELAEGAATAVAATAGEENQAYAWALNHIALAREAQGDGEGAGPLYERAAGILASAPGASPEAVAAVLNNLAVLRLREGDAQAAVPLLERVLEIQRGTLSDAHVENAATTGDLAMAHLMLGEHEQAERLLRDALAQMESLASDRPDLAGIYDNLGMLLACTGRADEARAYHDRAAAIDDDLIDEVLAMGSEVEQLGFIRKTEVGLLRYLSFVVQQLPGDPDAVRAAADLLLRRKGILADAWATRRELALSRADEGVTEKVARVQALREEIARKTVAGHEVSELDEHTAALHELRAEKEELEKEIAGAVATSRLNEHRRRIDCETVARALPEGAVLLELVRTPLLDYEALAAGEGQRLMPARYLALVLARGDGRHPRLVDLGDAADVDRTITKFRTAVTSRDEDALAPESTEAIAGPLLAAVGDAAHIIVAPAGEFTRLPLEVLPRGSGHLIDSVDISYVSVGRDVLRFGATPREASAPLVMADPDFDLRAETGAAGAAADELHRRNFPARPLANSRVEGEEVATALHVEPLLGADAVEKTLKRCRSPRVLHIASHGFFLPPPVARDEPDIGPSSRLTGPGMENPLVRSGIALAGFNTWYQHGSLPPEAEDGLLSAEDVAVLDLTGTQLVVLSACDTGLGEVLDAEGVFGLRRAFMLAGAATLVMSLWRVPDAETAELMRAFYAELAEGAPRIRALKHAQSELRKSKPHPYFWGAFVCQGDPGLLPP